MNSIFKMSMSHCCCMSHICCSFVRIKSYFVLCVAKVLQKFIGCIEKCVKTVTFYMKTFAATKLGYISH